MRTTLPRTTDVAKTMKPSKEYKCKLHFIFIYIQQALLSKATHTGSYTHSHTND